jgi:hypothetical protein
MHCQKVDADACITWITLNTSDTLVHVTDLDLCTISSM